MQKLTLAPRNLTLDLKIARPMLYLMTKDITKLVILPENVFVIITPPQDFVIWQEDKGNHITEPCNGNKKLNSSTHNPDV